MYINIIWVFLTIIISYILNNDAAISAETGIIFILLSTLFRGAGGILNLIRKHKDKSTISAKKKIEICIIYILAVLIISIFWINYRNKAQGTSQLSRINKAYFRTANKTLKKAVERLQLHKDDPEYCSLLFFPTLENPSQVTIAKYLARYKFEKQYCPSFWQWGENDCYHLKRFNYKGHPIEVLKNIRLCQLAHSGDYSKRISTRLINVNIKK